MSYAEAAYFDGVPCAHVAAWEERQRLARIARNASRAARTFERRRSAR